MRKVWGLIIVIIAMFLFIPAIMPGFYDKYIEPFVVVAMSPLRGHANLKLLFLCFVGFAGVVGAVMFMKK